MSLVGNITAANSQPDKPPANTEHVGKVRHFGWDRDLATVPELNIQFVENCTEANVLAGLYVENGSLVYDTDLMVADGAGAECQFHGSFIPERVQAPLYFMRMEFEHLNRAAGGAGSHNPMAILLEPDGVTNYIPDGSTAHYHFIQMRNEDTVYVRNFGNQVFSSSGSQHAILTLGVSPYDYGDGSFHASVAKTDSAYNTTSTVKAASARGAEHGVIPSDKLIQGLQIRVARPAGDATRYYAKIHKLDVYYIEVE